MQKIDFKKELKLLYKPSPKKVEIVDVPVMNFLMIDGMGDPNVSQEFKDAVEALFAFAYRIKFSIKKSEKAIDYSVMPLEGLWWADDMSKFSVEDKSSWKWTLMIMQPEFVSDELVKQCTDELKLKKDLFALSKIRFQSFEEGKAAQIMHIGPFSEEGPTVERVHQFIEENNSENRGKHHEIYLSDIRRGNPANWKTVIRQPME
ncbi:GyrI-like domain-containing protein [candidate division KSB1 bacterium]|nr:GyrI-like domain-containing protein [candidate division KSB1 bacterium]